MLIHGKHISEGKILWISNANFPVFHSRFGIYLEIIAKCSRKQINRQPVNCIFISCMKHSISVGFSTVSSRERLNAPPFPWRASLVKPWNRMKFVKMIHYYTQLHSAIERETLFTFATVIYSTVQIKICFSCTHRVPSSHNQPHGLLFIICRLTHSNN